METKTLQDFKEEVAKIYDIDKSNDIEILTVAAEAYATYKASIAWDEGKKAFLELAKFGKETTNPYTQQP